MRVLRESNQSFYLDMRTGCNVLLKDYIGFKLPTDHNVKAPHFITKRELRFNMQLHYLLCSIFSLPNQHVRNTVGPHLHEDC